MLSDNDLRLLIDSLDRPWTGYRKVRKGVKKRIRRHMQTLGCSTVDRYLRCLSRDPDARRTCDARLRVTISRFFRDRYLWQELHDRLLPDLVNRFGSPVRIWSAGCACGEEPYSLAIVWRQLTPAAVIDLLATDADGSCLERARAGIYTHSSLKELPDNIRKRYFSSARGGRCMRIRAQELPAVRWRLHDLRDPPPEPGPFHIILMRNNLLTYYRGDVMHNAVSGIVRVLTPSGCLVIGSHERLPEKAWPLKRDADCPWVYRRDG